MARQISIDFGTQNTVIAEKGVGVIINEPTLAAIDIKNNQLLAVGNEAKSLLGKTPRDIKVVSPIENGVIANFDIAGAILRTFIAEAFSKSAIRPKATICMPEEITEVEKAALFECVVRSGARSSYIKESPVASAVGSGIDISTPSGNMVLDIGGGKVCATVLSFGGVVATKTADCGGNKMDEAIVSYIKKNYGVKIGQKTAEEIKIEIGICKNHEKAFTAIGRDEISGLPKEITITADDVAYAISPQLLEIADLIKQVLENTPSELTRDICENGICLLGGVSKLSGIDKFIEKNVGIDTYISNNPLECTAIGALECFDRSDSK